MLASNPAANIPSGAETEICQWSANGTAQFVGFYISAPNGGQARLYIGGVERHRLHIPYTGEAPYQEMVDKPYIPAAATVFSLRFYHENAAAQIVAGAILGG